MAAIPRKQPAAPAVERCRIVAHRGQHDNNRSVRENTLHAFELARAGGVWGVEADIRWTADQVPVIIHDPDTMRVFGKPVTIADLGFEQLRQEVPEVPTLAELVEQFGRNTHLMLELKAEAFPEIGRQRQILHRHLSGLTPEEDYHVLSLDPILFETFDIRPQKACLPVALANMRSVHRKTLDSRYGGITGHFVLLSDKIKRSHEQAGRRVGTGFIRSRNCLYRELNRNVEWIFSNDAVKLQRIVDSLRGDML